MITKTSILIGPNLNPYANLAVEEYLLENIDSGEYILFLWQNKNTVVIGKNQNAWKECKTDELSANEGYLARRISGGGAVFHDLGNLNFSFICSKEDYSLENNLRIILDSVKKLDIDAEFSGRNDITSKGRKFSGNAFCYRKNGVLHHGTLLINVNMENLTKYLQVSVDKIKSKGIDSVRSRVVNLKDINNNITIESVKHTLLQTFKEHTKLEYEVLDSNALYGNSTVLKLKERNQTWEWLYGNAPKFDVSFSNRFEWGGLDLLLSLRDGVVQNCTVYSDAMDESFIESIPGILKGCKFDSDDIKTRISKLGTEYKLDSIANDICNWILKLGF